MNEWDTITQWYRTFLTNLIKHDWQRFLNYVRETSILGSLGIPIKDKKMVRKIFTLIAQMPKEKREDKKERRISFNQIAFILSLCFMTKEKISYLSDQISKGMMTPEELMYLKELAVIDC